jgi:hypothetical protein
MRLFDKLKILWPMRKWMYWPYIEWRLLTAYPTGWRNAIRQPIVFIKDINNYLKWCHMMDKHMGIRKRYGG